MYGLKSFLFFNDIGQLDVANYLGLSKAQMSRMVSGTAPFRHEYLMKLVANDRGWNSEFLTDPMWARLEADGKMMSSEGPSAVRKNMSHEVNALPLIPIDAVAGPGTPVYEDERVENFYQVSEFKDCDFLLRVKGDSMSPHFTGGDLLACKKVADAYYFQWGRCYVLLTRSQGAMVKRIQPSEKDGCVKCVSDNPRYAPFDVPMDDVVSVALVNGSISLE